MPSRVKLLLAFGVFLLAVLTLPGSRAEKKAPSSAELINTAVGELVKIQEEGGQWPYEGVYRVNGQLPIGYRVGGTSLAAITCAMSVRNPRNRMFRIPSRVARACQPSSAPLPATASATSQRSSAESIRHASNNRSNPLRSSPSAPTKSATGRESHPSARRASVRCSVVTAENVTGSDP